MLGKQDAQKLQHAINLIPPHVKMLRKRCKTGRQIFKDVGEILRINAKTISSHLLHGNNFQGDILKVLPRNFLSVKSFIQKK